MSGIMLMLVGGKGGEAPVNTVAPALNDSTPVYNQTISTTTGTWTSITVPTYAYQWQRNGGNISGATSSSYAITSTDVGTTIRCVVTATNPFGSTAANSNTSSTVAAIAPNAPTIGTATGGEEQASVAFTNLSFPTQTGGATIINYQAISTPGSITGTAAGTPVTLTGLTGGTAYTFKVRAQNSVGYGSYSGNSNSVTPTSPQIGLFSAGDAAPSGGSQYDNSISKISIASTGNTSDFGDLTVSLYGPAGAGSTTRGLIAGGQQSGGASSVIGYVTFSTLGNATTFGNLSQGRPNLSSGNSSTRAVFLGGAVSYSTSTMDYVTIATTGNATDFGDLNDSPVDAGMGRRNTNGSVCSATKIYYVGGNSGWDDSDFDNIQYITTATTGNSSSFGALSGAGITTSVYGSGASSSTRGVQHRGSTGSSPLGHTNTLFYFTMGTSGSSADFGDLTVSRSATAGVCSSSRAVWAGGRISSYGNSNVMDYVSIATTGNATDFGDLAAAKGLLAGCSNDNGGVQ